MTFFLLLFASRKASCLVTFSASGNHAAISIIVSATETRRSWSVIFLSTAWITVAFMLFPYCVCGSKHYYVYFYIHSFSCFSLMFKIALE